MDDNARNRSYVVSAPREGLSLASVTEGKSKAVREAVSVIADSLITRDLLIDLDLLFDLRWRGPAKQLPRPSTLPTRAAWNLVSMWLLAQASGEVSPHCSLAEGEDWFCGSVQTPSRLSSRLVREDVLQHVHQLLVSIELDQNFWQLLPYVLEEHGPGSRASVMRDPRTASARAAKRTTGVYYTPSDVADYMVGHTLQNFGRNSSDARCLDPSCGTGVFLLAFLRGVRTRESSTGCFDRFAYITRSLYGCDVSSQALDSCTFVLLRECLADVRTRGMSPWAAWHLIRLNLVDVDMLTVEPPLSRQAKETCAAANRLETIRSQLSVVPSVYIPPESCDVDFSLTDDASGPDLFTREATKLADVFPNLPNGFDFLVGNPPYAALGRRATYTSLTATYHSLPSGKGGAGDNSFPLFVELMWRLTVPGANAGALVTPLSMAFHRGAQYEACRNAMTWNGGRWQFAFFDREPHALFGEEVKTRNAILFRFENKYTPARGERAEIDTGPLRKWTSRTRKQLFQTINFTSLGQTNITPGIPKLDGTSQAQALTTLSKRLERFPSFCASITTRPPEVAFQEPPVPRVFVGGTAYNFLNVYRNTFLLDRERNFSLSESTIHCVEFRSEEDAQVGFAILSSRLVFWLWHVLGDGFHVARWLFGEIPFSKGSFSAEDYNELAELGRKLWDRLQAHRFLSVNGGKQTIGFRSLRCNEERDGIDTLLIQAAGLTSDFADELKGFVLNNTVVDSRDRRRIHLQEYFAEPLTT